MGPAARYVAPLAREEGMNEGGRNDGTMGYAREWDTAMNNGSVGLIMSGDYRNATKEVAGALALAVMLMGIGHRIAFMTRSPIVLMPW